MLNFLIEIAQNIIGRIPTYYYGLNNLVLRQDLPFGIRALWTHFSAKGTQNYLKTTGK